VKNLAKRKRIVSLRNQGKTFIEIAEIFGNCPYRVSGLYAEHMENLNECSKYPFRKYLSVRLRNALVHAFGVEILGKPEKMAEFGSGKLRSLKHFGKITVSELGVALEKFGYISDKKSWLNTKNP